MALAQLYKTLRRLADDVDVFLDSSVWDIHLDKKIWNELLDRGRSVYVLPQVRLELDPWLKVHASSRPASALLGKNPPFAVSAMPDPATDDGRAFA